MARQTDTQPHAGRKRSTAGQAQGKLTEPAGVTKRHLRNRPMAKEREPEVRKVGLDDDQKDKMQKVISKYGDPPLKDLVDDRWPPSKVVMAHILNALLSSTRISHNIVNHTLESLLNEEYNDIDVLRHTSWPARVKLLDAGGYARYDERTATNLGELRKLVSHKYDDDASKMLPAESVRPGEEARNTLSTRLKEVKGIGPVGATIFLGSMQHYCPRVAPFLDPRSLKSAAQVGLGSDVDAMFDALGHNTYEMAKLEAALTKVRLERREGEFITV